MFNAVSIDVDAVVTWVDGSQEAHKKNKQLHMSEYESTKEATASGKSDRRWENSNEILLCLNSLENHAPWIRNIWIVTDNQEPDLSSLSSEMLAKINIVDHRDIFRGYEQYLPTFNSLSIETVLWRIPGLADKYIYFNDDFFLSGRLEPTDLFDEEKPIVRGKWSDYSGENLSMYRRNQVNAAEKMGFTADRFFANAHVANIFNKKILAEYYEENPEDLELNLSHRFREYSQYSSISLMTHLGIKQDRVVLSTKKEWQNISVKICKSKNPALIESKLNRLLDKKIKFGCINDMVQASETYPQTLDVIRRAIGTS